jgi:DegV family protein with EDD domain
MAKIAVITDTDSSIPEALAAKYGIHQAPITIHFGNETFASGVDIDDNRLFERIDQTGKLPTTSAPAPGAFSKAFKAAFEAGTDSIVCICVSSKVSATYTSALTAVEQFPGRKITVIDSLSLSMGQGFMVLAAAEAAASGASHEEIVNHARSLTGRMHLYATLTTLKYLAMSGRVGKVAAGMATVLNIRPILTIRDGELAMLEKVRTKKAAMQRLVDLLKDSVNGKTIERAAIIHVNNTADGAELEAQLRACLNLPENVITTAVSPGLSVHSGSGMVGAVFVAGK